MQWLDEVEDLIFAFALAWHGLCRLCLSVGFVASLSVVIFRAISFTWLLGLTAIAVASVLAWSVAVVASLVGATRITAASA